MIDDENGFLEDPQCYDPPRRRWLTNDTRQRHLERFAAALNVATHGSDVDAKSVERVFDNYLRSNRLTLVALASACEAPASPGMISALAQALASVIATSSPPGSIAAHQIADQLRLLGLNVDLENSSEAEVLQAPRG
jgi:hypothetical protein